MLCDSKSNFIEFTLDFQRNYNISILKKKRKTNAKMSVENSRLTFLSLNIDIFCIYDIWHVFR
jgi:hypothetical protein